MARSAHSDLLRLHQRLYKRNQDIIANSVQVRDPQFRRYAAAYQRAVARYQRRVSPEGLLRAIGQADIIVCGDYHTCAQSQRDFLRYAKAAQTMGRPLVIGLELLHTRRQPALDAYVRGELTTAQFLTKSGMRAHWVFDLWPHFAPIFEFAAYHTIPLYAIDAAGPHASLTERDVASGARIAQITAAHPDAQLFVLIGDMHLAPPHLPAGIMDALQAQQLKRRTVLLYQNSEPIYWQLVRKGIEHSTAAVQLAPDAYCRMHTPPIVYQQSYLNWLEHDEGEIDFADARGQFLELVRTIARFLRTTLPADFDQLTVYTCGDLRFLTRLRQSGQFTDADTRAITRHILRGESYIVPQQRMVYLGKLSINHSAEEAAHYLRYLCAGAEPSRTPADAFFANVLHEALGFFGSKLINGRRKCLHEAAIERTRRFFARQPTIPRGRVLEAQAIAWVSAFLRAERQQQLQAFRPMHAVRGTLFLAVTHLLGYMLGERLFYGLLSRRISRRAVRELFCDGWTDEGRPYTVYRELRKKLADIKIPARM